MRYYSEENVIDLLDAFMDKVNDETKEDLKTLIRDRAKTDNFDVIELPPHGRLIDADILRMKYEYGDGRKKVDKSPTVIEASKETEAR